MTCDGGGTASAAASMHEWKGRACSTIAERHASTAADNEREAKRLRAALRSGHYGVRSETELVAQIASNTEAQAAVERAAERKSRARARFHDALRLKYERASRYPWISVGPDPPEPESRDFASYAALSDGGSSATLGRADQTSPSSTAKLDSG